MVHMIYDMNMNIDDIYAGDDVICIYVWMI
jgi:hypothetical protein